MGTNVEDLALAQSMIKSYGSRAVVAAEEQLVINASIGNRVSASKWLRVAALIEFSELRTSKRTAR